MFRIRGQGPVTSTLDPLRGLPLETVDANNRKTDMTYDALGRQTAVWLPGRDKSTGQSADKTFTYSVNPGAVGAPGGTITQPGAPTSVTTKTLREDESYSTSIAIYDGMLQPRQTQATASGDVAAGRIISDTFYDSHGWPSVSYAAYSEPTSDPSTTLFAANENEIPSETTTTFDGQGRTLASSLWHQAIKQWSTTTSYPGADEVDTTAPVGGRSTATFTNALGQTTRSVVKNTGTTAMLSGGQVIPSGTSLTSGSVRLAMQADGNLVLTGLATGKTIWSSGTSGNPGAYAKFSTDGNLVVYTTAGVQKWTTGLTATTGATFRVGQDSTVAVVAANGSTLLWKQGTAGAVAVADATTSYTYSPAGQVSTIKDNAGNAWSYQYDLLGRKTKQTDPNTGTTTFDKYDVAGNLLQTTDSRGQKLSYAYDWDNRKVAEYAGAWSASPSTDTQLGSWTYDTLAKGYATSSTRYVGGSGSTGKAYTQAVTGYNTAYQPTSTTATVPAADGFAAAGQTTAPTSGNVTYTSTTAYTPHTGLLSTVHYGADGNLPAEDVDYGYTLQGNLDSFGGYINAANTPAYLDIAVHDPFGRIKQANYGSVGKEIATFAQYDDTTGAVTQTSSMLQTQTAALDVVNYRYNQAGEVTAIDDLQNNTTHDTQCFTYDSFQRLTDAWTDTAGITSPTSAPVGSVGGCTTTRVQTNGTTPVKTSTVGGPAAYWQTYTYDQLGDRTGMVNHDTTGNALNDTTQTIAYTGTDGTTTATLPDQAGATTTTNPATGTTTQTPTYTDPAYSNTNAGNTITRKTVTSGPLATGFTLAAGGKLCIDDANASVTPGAKVRVYTCNASAAQNWTISTDGTVKVLGVCLDTTGNATTAGTLVVLDTCSADATQKWKVATDGTLVNNAKTTMCLTDPAAAASGTQLTLATCGSTGQKWSNATTGAIPAGQTQSFTYDPEGRTATVTTGTGATTNTSKYLYDANGQLLEQTLAAGSADKTRVLYLFGGTEQITLNVAAKTWTGLRNYIGPDGTCVTRTSAGGLAYQVANTQGTATTSVDASTLTVTRRAYSPYGDPRGAQPTTWVSADENRGFLGKPADTTTGLNLLGARNYDAAQGRFLTPDPVFEAGDPNQMGGYTYAADNPASHSDPTGLDPCGGLKCGHPGDDCMHDDAIYCPGGGDDGYDTSTYEPDSGSTDDSSGGDSGYLDSGTGTPSSGNTEEGGAGGTTGMAPPPSAIVWNVILGLVSNVPATASLFGWLFDGDCWNGGAGAPGCDYGGDFDNWAAHHGGNPDSDAYQVPSFLIQMFTSRDPGEVRPNSKPGGAPCSFTPSTQVLMADGKTKAIGSIELGDKVEAADPKTGKHKGERTVTATWVHRDEDLVDLTIEDGGGADSTLHTTSLHPFWDDSKHAWVPAGRLTPGHELNTANGHHVVVIKVQVRVDTAEMRNLTVSELHTYYVLSGTTPVLVHNSCGPVKNSKGDELPFERMAADFEGVTKISAGTSEFTKAAAGNGSYLWIVSEGGELNMVRSSPGIHHTIASDGESVMAAGQVTFNGGRVTSFDNLTGHYTPKPECACVFIQRGVDAFATQGVRIPRNVIRDYGGMAP
ncbi:polymorphic toxin-type HINT domain-containing protein [Streptomyces sp. NBC_00247]|uniref:polymorphic toxin-type HINT domain-containing protein n=1 Tax=Streptomyces sp. NBC_00247 TaxID=2975689 RepID=UPI002E2CCCF2|nr:polymorphic toxin-type HINT domain-containing protein [Streptomyces sp. NBC_00247]